MLRAWEPARRSRPPVLALLLLLAAPIPPPPPPREPSRRRGGRARERAETELPLPYARHLEILAGKVHVLRLSRGDTSRRPPAIGKVAQAISHAIGRLPLGRDEEEGRALAQDLLAVWEAERGDAGRQRGQQREEGGTAP